MRRGLAGLIVLNAALAGVGLVAQAPTRTGQPNSSGPVTFNGHRAVWQSCANCHRPRIAPFSLISYRTSPPRTRDRSRGQKHRMPPWMPNLDGEFADARRLTDDGSR